MDGKSGCSLPNRHGAWPCGMHDASHSHSNSALGVLCECCAMNQCRWDDGTRRIIRPMMHACSSSKMHELSVMQCNAGKFIFAMARVVFF